MFKKGIAVCCLAGLYIFLVSLVKHPEQDTPNHPSQKKPLGTIIIDPGHGGIDGGAPGQFSREKEVTLALGLKLGKKIQEAFPDIKVIYTRTTDILPGNLNNISLALRYRAELANKSNADLFISLHCDAAGQKAGGWYAKRVSGYTTHTSYVGKGKKKKKVVKQVPVYETYWVENKAQGASTYIWAADRSDKKSEYISQQDHEGGEVVEDSTGLLDLNSPEAKIRLQLYTKFFFKNSFTIADYVQQEFEKAGRINRGVLQRNNTGIWVLQATGMPSILVETGYISNTQEEKYLNSESGQNEITDNILSAIKRYKQDLEHPKK